MRGIREKFIYDADWKGPLSIQRQSTDFFWSLFALVYFILIILLGLWFILNCPSGKILKHDPQTNRVYLNIDDLIESERQKAKKGIPIVLSIMAIGFCIAVTFGMSVMNFILLKKFPRAVSSFYLCLSYIILLSIFIFSLFSSLGRLDLKIPNQLPQMGQLHYVLGMIVSGFLLVLATFIIILFQKEIKIGNEIIKLTCKAISSFPLIFIVPIIQFLIILPVLVYTFMVFICAVKMMTHDSTNIPLFILFTMTFVYLFTMVWIVELTLDTGRFVVSGSVAIWYWTKDKDLISSNVIKTSVNLTYRFHFGTVAIGSLLMSLFSTIKFIFDLITVWTLFTCVFKMPEQVPSFSHCCTGFCNLFCVGVEMLTKYTARSAYIFTASHGTGFFESAEMAFYLIKRNMTLILINSFWVSNGLFYSSLLVTLFIPMLVASILFRNEQNIIIIIILACVLLSFPFSWVVTTALNTIFLCTLEDYERHDGSDTRPYYMPQELQTLIVNN